MELNLSCFSPYLAKVDDIIYLFFSSANDDWSEHYFPLWFVNVLGYFHCWLQSCVAYPLCCWRVWNYRAHRGNWHEEKERSRSKEEKAKEEASFCEEWCNCCLLHSGILIDHLKSFPVMSSNWISGSADCNVFSYLLGE